MSFLIDFNPATIIT